MKEPLVSRILKYALYTVFVVGILITITLPYMLDTYSYIFNDTLSKPYGALSVPSGYRGFILVFLRVVAVPGLWIVLEMIGMLRSIPKDPFVKRNVQALNRIGIIFLLLSTAFFFKCLWYITFLTLVCALFFIGSGLFAFTLATLIRQSIVFREENELTI